MERNREFAAAALVAMALIVTGGASAQEAYQAASAEDPAIPVDQLKWLVKPLTQEELIVEADAWRDLLKRKVKEISDAEIAVKRRNEQIDAAAVAARKAEKAGAAAERASDLTGGVAVTPVDTNAVADGETHSLETVAETAKAKAASDSANKKAILAVLTELRGERAALIERLDAVLDELASKGGDIEGYLKYRDAVSEVIVDVSDTSAMWTFLSGWLTSEQGGIKWAVNTAKFLAIMMAFWVLSIILGKATNTATGRSRRMSSLLKVFLNTAVRRSVILVGIMVGISAMGIPIGPVLAIITAAGFVVGLALQGTLSNFASGLLILAYRPFDIDDAVEAGGVSGIVTAMNLMSTQIMTWDNRQMIVPNNEIWGNVITNITGTDKRRVDMVFGIGYGDSIEKAQALLDRIAREHPKTLEDPEPVVAVHELADSSVNFVVRPWARPADYWAVYWDITRQVKEAFDKEGISIPFPQRDVHLLKEE